MLSDITFNLFVICKLHWPKARFIGGGWIGISLLSSTMKVLYCSIFQFYILYRNRMLYILCFLFFLQLPIHRTACPLILQLLVLLNRMQSLLKRIHKLSLGRFAKLLRKVSHLYYMKGHQDPEEIQRSTGLTPAGQRLFNAAQLLVMNQRSAWNTLKEAFSFLHPKKKCLLVQNIHQLAAACKIADCMHLCCLNPTE